MHLPTEGRLEGWDVGESPFHLGFLGIPGLALTSLQSPVFQGSLGVLERKRGSGSRLLPLFGPSPSISSVCPSQCQRDAGSGLSAVMGRGMEGLCPRTAEGRQDLVSAAK